MSVKPFNASVGRKRLTKSVNSTEADFTMQVRAQISDIVAQVNAWVANIDGESANILYDALLPTFELSQEYVPVKTGDLKESGFLEKERVRGHAQVQMGYAKGGDPHYAVYVHEIPDYKHEAPTRDKFLQAALEEDADEIQSRIIEGYRTAAGVNKP